MANHVEWVDAVTLPSRETNPDWTYPYGSSITPGKIGVWLAGTVLMEGTPEQFLAYADRLRTIAGGGSPMTLLRTTLEGLAADWEKAASQFRATADERDSEIDGELATAYAETAAAIRKVLADHADVLH